MIIRAKPHWTRRYIVDRLFLAARERIHPDDPWLTARAIAFLDDWIRPSDEVIEWGSGRSTAWIAHRAGKLVSVEHDDAWAAEITVMTSAADNLRLVVHSGDSAEEYADADADFEPASFDLALVDGIHRDLCVKRALDLVRAGGAIVVDNAERYMPSASRSPEAIGSTFASDLWEEFWSHTLSWHRVWTSNGVTDTAIWFVP